MEERPTNKFTLDKHGHKVLMRAGSFSLLYIKECTAGVTAHGFRICAPGQRTKLNHPISLLGITSHIIYEIYPSFNPVHVYRALTNPVPSFCLFSVYYTYGH